MLYKMRVAVIGAGACGLAAIKCCLDEGLDVVSFEQDTHIGGLWKYKDTARPDQSTVLRSTVTNACKEVMSFSDFPMPAEFPAFLRHDRLLQYLRMYADEFGLVQYIRFETEVVDVRRAEDFTSTGCWVVTSRKRQQSGGDDDVDQLTDTEVFDAVLVCNGHDTKQFVPNFDGQQNFVGNILHSHDYRLVLYTVVFYARQQSITACSA